MGSKHQFFRITLALILFKTSFVLAVDESQNEAMGPDPIVMEPLPEEVMDSPALAPTEEAKGGSGDDSLQSEIKSTEIKPAKAIKGKELSRREMRIQHARELLGRFYRHSSIRAATVAKESKIKKLVYRLVKERLPAEFRSDSKRIAKAILDVSAQHSFDPIFLMSVIQNESSFIPDRLGSLDEIGLMQLRPATARWISQTSGLKWKGLQSLFDPVVNIQIGAIYLSYLREKFDSHARLYLAAYNMGARSVGVALTQKIWPKDYPIHVMRYYVQFYALLDQHQG